MVICSPQVNALSTASGSSVTDRPASPLLGPNQATYERLRTALSLDLRRQIFIAVCDDLPLRDRLAMQLQTELAYFAHPSPRTAAPRAMPRLVTLELDLNDPNPLTQVVAWLNDVPPVRSGRYRLTPAFQIVGIERLTRQSASTQTVFLSYLQLIEPQLAQIESSLIFWMTQPWFRMLSEGAPEFWRCRTGVFEFIGDPTPLPVASPERIQIDASREFSGPSLPETNPDRRTESTDPLNSFVPIASTPQSENPWLPLANELNLWEEPDVQAVADGVDRMPAFDLKDWPGLNPLTADQPQQNWNDQDVEDQDVETVETLLSVAIATQQFTQAQQTGSDAVVQELAALHADLENHIAQALDSASLQQLWTDQTVPDQAISLLQHISLLQFQIEQLQQGQESPEGLAMAYRTLGNFYRDCIEQGDASLPTLEVAIQVYEQALQWLPEASLDRAETLNDVGNLYWMVAQTQPDQARHSLQQTVQSYEQALRILESDPQQPLAVIVYNNLGATYADLARYDQPEANLSRSVAAYEQVLHARTAESDPLRYASTQNNLGTTFWNLAQYQQPQFNLRQAVHAYTEALRYHDVTQEPLHYAMIHNNLGTAYWNLAQYEQPVENLRQALAAYQVALQYRPVEIAPASFAATQNNIGTACWHLASYTTDQTERLSHLQQAIAAYQITLETAAGLEQPALLNFDLAATRNHLGLAHYQLATLQTQVDPDAQAAHLQAALHHHLLTLEDWTDHPDFRAVAVTGIVQTIRAFYLQLGLTGQNQALAQLPAQLLPEILPKL